MQETKRQQPTNRAEEGPDVFGFIGFIGPVEVGAAGPLVGIAEGNGAALEPPPTTPAWEGFPGDATSADVVRGGDEVVPNELPPKPYLSSTEDWDSDGLVGVSTAGV